MLTDNRKQVFVIGHKNPDCDSIGSAISYAYFKNILDKKYVYIPARAGELNAETKFVLKKFKVEPPMKIESLVATVNDMELKKPFTALPSDSIRDVASLMKEKNIRTVPITDSNKKLLGIVSLREIAEDYINYTDLRDVSRTPIDLNILIDTLDAKVITNPKNIKELTGKIFVAAMQRGTTLNKIEQGDIVILGDRWDIQIDLINLGCLALIITGNLEISHEVIRLAEEKGTLIISSHYDTFTTAKLFHLSRPLYSIMSKEIQVVGLYTPISEVRRKALESKHRCVLVVNGDNRLIGIITRTNLIQPIRKRVILVDHNEIAQAADGVQEAEILEIIDHHRVGDISTLMPIYVYNEPIGSTCTIIARSMFLHQINIPKDIAGLLLSGILSDTLLLTLSTTEHDKEIAYKLAQIANIEIDQYGKGLLASSIDIKGKTAKEILFKDFKEYILGNKKIGVSQIMVLDKEEITAKEHDIKLEMEKLRKEKQYDLIAFLITNPLQPEQEEVLVKGEKLIIEKAFGIEIQNDKCIIPGILSRKKDFIPKVGYVCSIL